MKNIFTQLKSAGIKGFLYFGAFLIVWNSFYITSGTEYAVKKAPNGSLTPIIDGGVHFKIPFLTDITRYDIVLKTTYVDDNDADPLTHGTMKRITFTDTYGGMIGGTLLYRLDPTRLIKMHTTYHSQYNLIETGLKPSSKQLLAYTANQFSGESFMQGGQNEYQNRVEDQANNGLLVTKRERDTVAKSISTVGLGNENPTTRDEIEENVYVTNIQYDENGTALRVPLAINDFDIRLAQVTIDDFKPDKKLREFIDRKQNQIAARQDIIEKQENARQGAILAEAKGAQERTEAKQSQLKEKEVAVILAQQKVELEQKEAEKQVVGKQKDLDIALMEKKIQKAKSESTIFEAQAIEAKGLAEAAVTRAKYAAIKPDIFAAEVERDIQLAKYKALPNVKIQMPNNVMVNSGAKGSSSIDDLANIQIIEKLGSMK